MTNMGATIDSAMMFHLLGTSAWSETSVGEIIATGIARNDLSKKLSTLTSVYQPINIRLLIYVPAYLFLYSYLSTKKFMQPSIQS